MKNKLLVVVMFSCWSLIITATATEQPSLESGDKVITLGLLDFPPQSYMEPNSNKCVGFGVELTRRIFVEYGYQLDAICAPAIRVYRMLQNDKIDMTINIRSTTLLPEHVDFFDTPFAELNLVFLTHKDKGFQNMISAIRGFDYHGHRQSLLAQGFVFQDMPGSSDAIRMFARGRTRHLITYKAPYRFHLARNGFNIAENTEVKYLETIPTYFAISKTSPKWAIIHKILSQHVEKTQIKQFSELLPFF